MVRRLLNSLASAPHIAGRPIPNPPRRAGRAARPTFRAPPCTNEIEEKLASIEKPKGSHPLRSDADSDPLVQSSAANALSAIEITNPEQHTSVLDALVTLTVSDETEVQEAVAAALLHDGPLDTDHLGQLLAKVDQESPRVKPRLRAIGWAFNGTLPGPDPGATLLTFAGQPTPVPGEPIPGDRKRALQVLSVFEKFWPHARDSEKSADRNRGTNDRHRKRRLPCGGERFWRRRHRGGGGAHCP